MGSPVKQLRDLLRLAASLRGSARESSQADYARKLLHAAAELEARAQYLAEHREDEPIPAATQDAALYAPVDIRV